MSKAIGGTASSGFDVRADANWCRYEYLRSRGHREWCDRALLCEDMYEGAGKQWSDQARGEIGRTRRMPTEQNEIRPAVNAAVGYQISNRMDISFTPRGHGADDDTADTLGKVARQVADNNKLPWVETEVFTDGMITGRGWFDVRMNFDDSILGEIEIISLDGLDVIPDCDATEYNPDKGWADITTTRWYTIDQIESYYGKKARQAVLNFAPSDLDYQGWDADRLRSRFGTNTVGGDYYDATRTDVDSRRYRIIDRQYSKFEMCDVMLYPAGDVRIIPNDTPPEKVEEWREAGGYKSRRMMRKVHWLVSTSGVTLFDDTSPYPFFTQVGFFPYFRRGRTTGMVDNAISPQNILNKALSTGLHIFNTAAKGGWQGEENQLANMNQREFEEKAGMPGLIIMRKAGTPKLDQIIPPPMPAAISDFINRSLAAIKSVTGISEELNAENSADMSGVAIQARQFAAQQKLAIPLDNLARTRNLLANKILWMIQRFMSSEQIIRITEKDSMGKPQTSELPINQPQADGSTLNDLTIGEYDVVISEQPLAVTFDNTQFNQMKEIGELLQKQGESVPAEWLVRYSNISDKSEFMQALNAAKQANAQNQPPVDPSLQAKADLATAQAALATAKQDTEKLTQQLLAAQVSKTQNEGVQAGVVAIYSATQAAAEVAAMPQVAGIADEILGSAGFKDQDAPPIIATDGSAIQPPGQGAGIAAVAPPAPTLAAPPQHLNTDPVTPAGPPSPRVGADAGIEKPGVQ